MDAATMVEEFEKQWPNLPKKRVWAEDKDGRLLIRFACELREKQLVVSVLIGPRGGLREEVVLIDPRQRIVVDRLLLGPPTPMMHLLPIQEIRQKALQDKGKAQVLVHEEMERLLKKILKKRGEWLRLIRGLPTPSQSDRFWIGGAPGLGKRH